MWFCIYLIYAVGNFQRWLWSFLPFMNSYTSLQLTLLLFPSRGGIYFPTPGIQFVTCFGQWVLAKVIQKTWKYVLIGACFLLLSRILLPSYEQARVSLLEDGRPQRQSPWLPEPSQKRLQTWKWAPPRPPGPSHANSAPENHQIIGNVKCLS